MYRWRLAVSARDHYGDLHRITVFGPTLDKLFACTASEFARISFEYDERSRGFVANTDNAGDVCAGDKNRIEANAMRHGSCEPQMGHSIRKGTMDHLLETWLVDQTFFFGFRLSVNPIGIVTNPEEKNDRLRNSSLGVGIAPSSVSEASSTNAITIHTSAACGVQDHSTSTGSDFTSTISRCTDSTMPLIEKSPRLSVIFPSLRTVGMVASEIIPASPFYCTFHSFFDAYVQSIKQSDQFKPMCGGDKMPVRAFCNLKEGNENVFNDSPLRASGIATQPSQSHHWPSQFNQHSSKRLRLPGPKLSQQQASYSQSKEHTGLKCSSPDPQQQVSSRKHSEGYIASDSQTLSLPPTPHQSGITDKFSNIISPPLSPYTASASSHNSNKRELSCSVLEVSIDDSMNGSDSSLPTELCPLQKDKRLSSPYSNCSRSDESHCAQLLMDLLEQEELEEEDQIESIKTDERRNGCNHIIHSNAKSTLKVRPIETYTMESNMKVLEKEESTTDNFDAIVNYSLKPQEGEVNVSLYNRNTSSASPLTPIITSFPPSLALPPVVLDGAYDCVLPSLQSPKLSLQQNFQLCACCNEIISKKASSSSLPTQAHISPHTSNLPLNNLLSHPQTFSDREGAFAGYNNTTSARNTSDAVVSSATVSNDQICSLPISPTFLQVKEQHHQQVLCKDCSTAVLQSPLNIDSPKSGTSKWDHRSMGGENEENTRTAKEIAAGSAMDYDQLKIHDVGAIQGGGGSIIIPGASTYSLTTCSATTNGATSPPPTSENLNTSTTQCTTSSIYALNTSSASFSPLLFGPNLYPADSPELAHSISAHSQNNTKVSSSKKSTSFSAMSSSSLSFLASVSNNSLPLLHTPIPLQTYDQLLGEKAFNEVNIGSNINNFTSLQQQQHARMSPVLFSSISTNIETTTQWSSQQRFSQSASIHSLQPVRSHPSPSAPSHAETSVWPLPKVSNNFQSFAHRQQQSSPSLLPERMATPIPLTSSHGQYGLVSFRSPFMTTPSALQCTISPLQEKDIPQAQRSRICTTPSLHLYLDYSPISRSISTFHYQNRSPSQSMPLFMSVQKPENITADASEDMLNSRTSLFNSRLVTPNSSNSINRTPVLFGPYHQQGALSNNVMQHTNSSHSFRHCINAGDCDISHPHNIDTLNRSSLSTNKHCPSVSGSQGTEIICTPSPHAPVTECRTAVLFSSPLKGTYGYTFVLINICTMCLGQMESRINNEFRPLRSPRKEYRSA